MYIKICKKYSTKKKLIKKVLEQYPNAEIKTKSCIGMCKSCKLQVSAVIDGTKIKKKSIKKFLKELVYLQ